MIFLKALRKPKLSLRTSLWLAFAALVAFISLATLTVSFMSTNQLMDELSRPFIEQTQEQVDIELKRLIEPTTQRVVAAHRWVQDGVVQRYDSDALMKLFLPDMFQMPQCVSMMVSDMSGYEFTIFRNESGGQIPVPENQVQWTTRDFRRDDWGKNAVWTLWDENGNQKIEQWEQAAMWDDGSVYDPRSRAWHRGPRQDYEEWTTAEMVQNPLDAIHWTDVDLFFTSKAPGITASMATKDPNGDIVVIAYDLLLRDLSTFSSNLQPTKNGKAPIFTESRHLVGLPRDNRLAINSLMKPVDALGIPELTTLMTHWRERQSDTTGIFSFESEGQHWWAGIRPVSISTERRLWVAVLIPDSDLNAEARKYYRSSIMGVGTLALALSMVLALVVSRKFARPLDELAHQSRRIAARDLTPGQQVSSRIKEVQQLSNSIETMRESLDYYISAIRQAEESGRNNLQFLETLIDTIPNPIFFKDTNGVYLGCNKTYADQIMGLSREQIIGHSYQDLREAIPPDLADIHNTQDMKLLQEPGVQIYEAKSQCADRIRRDFIIYKATFNDAADNIAGIVGVMLNITQRKQAEEKVRKLNEELEKRVQERTGQLKATNQALQRAKVRAETANRAKSAFLANMSHELRTPLNAILGYTHILKQSDNLSAPQMERVDIINQSGRHLLSIINDVLDLAKIEAEKMELELTEFHLPAFLEEVTGYFRLQAEQKGLAFSFKASTDLPDGVRADKKHLRQVLINLLSNAIKFTDQGEVKLRVSIISRQTQTERKDNGHRLLPPDRIRFEVKDTGIGITPDQIEKIFLPFEQGRHIAHHIEGTGLGLAISLKLVQMMGGELHVRSDAGQGTVFWFEIPLPLVEVPATGQTQDSSPAIIGYTGPRRTILVVDDNAHNAAFLLDLLTPLDFKIVKATDGQEAVDLARTAQPDAILMDLIMPGMNGFEAVQKIRQQPDGQKVVIIAITASAFAADEQLSLQAGCNDFLPKPIQPETLLELLQSHLQLEWHCKPRNNGSGSPVGLVSPPAEKLIPPPPDQMDILLDMARKGDMLGIQAQATEIALMAEEYEPFAVRLRQLARNFEVKQVRSLIKEFVEQDRLNGT